MKFLKGVAATLGISSAAVAYAFLAPSVDTSKEDREELTLAGQLKLRILRLLNNSPLGTGVSKELQMPMRFMQSITGYQIPTRNGLIPCTVYTPFSVEEGPLPVYVNFHGGGFALRHAEQDDMPCRYFADQGQCVVVNVDYDVAPEESFPRPVHECFDAVKWVERNSDQLGIDKEKIAVGGFSAGGNLAAAVALMNQREKAFTLSLQVLNYAPLDFSTPYERKNLLLSKNQVVSKGLSSLFDAAYLPFLADREQALASPVLSENLSELPPALIISAEYDVLKSDSEKYAEVLKEANVPVTYQEFAGVDHAFTHLGPASSALEAWDLVASTLKKTFYS